MTGGAVPQQHPPQMYGQQPYPAVPGQPYGGQYAQPPSSGGGAKVALIIGGAFVLVLILGAVAFFVFSDGGAGGLNSSDPREVADG
ncbi:hypothetical protein OG563_07100 [Nocardia vinacea]|uniref:Uncharacterized protein n=1 Tax=Nocardia vinacea TaxID=96468 RepID=A0ABZ1Z1S0_9NOCA|nr:hypothetical protein [Nocardia vinacea]